MEKVDLYKWITEMTQKDYESYSKAHKALGSSFKKGVFNMVNVETIGLDTLVQQYDLKSHTPTHLKFYSQQSKAYILRWIPLVIGEPWEMFVTSTSSATCRLTCIIGVDYPGPVVKALGWLNSFGGFFLNKHLKTEVNAFAEDIEAKFA